MAIRFPDHWKNIRSLAEGGQAWTFLVHDTNSQTDEEFVLKILKNHDRIGRFRHEVDAIRKLNHPNIVSIVDADLEAENPYFVTEYCAGGSLDKATPFWRNSPLEALDLFEQICVGLVCAHSNSIIHRDIKPGNIFLRSETGPAVLGDFGLCFLQDDPERLTHTQEAVGARQYMAPELEDGKLDDVTDKCDIYSLGKLLYWLLSPDGKLFSREKYRDQQWDLKRWNVENPQRWDNIYMEHANRLLDLMVVTDPRALLK